MSGQPKAFVYFLRHAQRPAVKIGISVQPLVRRATLPEETDLSQSHYISCSGIPASRLEDLLHALFDEYRVDMPAGSGYTEWFHLECFEQVKDFLRQYQKQLKCSDIMPLQAIEEPVRPWRDGMEQYAPETPGTIHFVLQGKGGVGKTLIAMILARYFKRNQQKVERWDLDPVCRSWSRMTGARPIPYSHHAFGRGAEKLNASLDEAIKNGSINVVDVGPSMFEEVLWYLQSLEPIRFFSELKVKIMFHVVLAGGEVLDDTLRGLRLVRSIFPDDYIVAWHNEWFGSSATSTAFPQHRQVRLPRLERWVKEKVILLDEAGEQEDSFSNGLYEGKWLHGLESVLFPQINTSLS